VPTNRLEAFSDGVMAVIITIMVLDLHVPDGDTFAAFASTLGTGLATYLLSFVYIGIYWNNHHHLFQIAERTTGAVLWANLHLLLWLSLLPLTTAWMDATGFARAPVVVYGIDLAAAAIAYWILQQAIIHGEGAGSGLRQALGRDAKGKVSPAIYAAAILVALLVVPHWRAGVWISVACYVAAALLWLVPDRRIERYLAARRTESEMT
jgi:uncharacterized membrane protein